MYRELYVLFCFVINLCISDEDNFLRVGNAINVYANFGDLSQSGRMISIFDSEDDSIFWEKSVPIFADPKEVHHSHKQKARVQMYLCDTVEELLQTYYKDFYIEGTDKPWKALMGDWTEYEILKAFGVTMDEKMLAEDDFCCFALFKYTMIEKNATLCNDCLNASELIAKESEKVDFEDVREIRKFAEYYGSHYIDSYVTGDALYQVFVYKGPFQSHAYKHFKFALRAQGRRKRPSQRELEYYFSSSFLKQIGTIMASSGNVTIENWAHQNLKDKRYRFTKSTLLVLTKSLTKSKTLNELMRAGSGALLGLGLKISAPVFSTEIKQTRFRSVMDNDHKLWEINA